MLQTAVKTSNELKPLKFKELALELLIASGTDRENALPLADVIASYGLRYIPIYCSHLKCSKVNGKARPVI